MKRPKSPCYTSREPKHHAESGVCAATVTALRIAREFRDRQPTVAELMARHGMSRATAYRWRAAWQYVVGAEMTKNVVAPKCAEVSP